MRTRRIPLLRVEVKEDEIVLYNFDPWLGDHTFAYRFPKSEAQGILENLVEKFNQVVEVPDLSPEEWDENPPEEFLASDRCQEISDLSYNLVTKVVSTYKWM